MPMTLLDEYSIETSLVIDPSICAPLHPVHARFAVLHIRSHQGGDGYDCPEWVAYAQTKDGTYAPDAAVQVGA